MKLTIGYFYPKLLNLYGDTGNVEILAYRAHKRKFDVEIIYIDLETSLNEELMSRLNIVFMGGGPDSSQQNLYKDLVEHKGSYLKAFIENDGVGLFICGAYQLLGHYYKSSDGSTLEGLGIFDLYTQHFGNHKPRCIGNMVCQLSDATLNDIAFRNVNFIGDSLVGFENHGGRTYLGDKAISLGNVLRGFGNNGEDSTEGAIYKNAFGTYLHGPILSKNPHFADYLIAKSLKLAELEKLDDNIIQIAHHNARKLRV